MERDLRFAGDSAGGSESSHSGVRAHFMRTR